MSDDILKITAANGVPFTVRIVRQGDRFGLDMRLVHERDEPMIELYDARFDDERFSPGLGQFVSRYNAATILGEDEWSNPREPDEGLCLQGGVPAWRIDGRSMEEIVAWAEGRLEASPPGLAR